MSRRTAPATETTKATDDVVDEDDDLRDLLGMSPRRAPAMLSSGQVIDDAYRIEEELGAGGMGRVYRARDLKLGRDVALKLHAVALAPDDDSLRREAIALARLTHPNVVTVYGVGAWSGHPWVAMEYVPGGNARSWLTA
ncbi:MAG: protein kinase, partial [Myxococcales bacterium]|nr:protein kinase [Myxococcales bacterium]